MMMMKIIIFYLIDAINHAADAWGIRCMRYEIKDIQLPTKVRDAMQMQVLINRYMHTELVVKNMRI